MRTPGSFKSLLACACVFVSLSALASTARADCYGVLNQKWLTTYPIGSYWDTCKNVYWQNDKTELTADCQKDTATRDEYAEASLRIRQCCIRCPNWSSSDGSFPYYAYVLSNKNGVLSCENPIIPIPSGCPGYEPCGCKFPFTVKGKTYTSCTSDGTDPAKPWCVVPKSCADTGDQIYGTDMYFSSKYCS